MKAEDKVQVNDPVSKVQGSGKVLRVAGDKVEVVMDDGRRVR